MIWEGASKEIGNDDGMMYLFNLRQYSSYVSQQFLQIHVVIVATLPVTCIRQKMGWVQLPRKFFLRIVVAASQGNCCE